MILRRSTIGWCDYSGASLNFIIGCTPKSEGCANCYGFRWAKRAGRDFREIRTYPQKLGRLWRAKWSPDGKPYRRGPGSKPVMFPVDLGDLFHEEAEEDFIMAALDMMLARNDADWVVLTKRAKRMYSIVKYWLEFNELKRVPAHIWLMVTAENQKRADERIPILLQIKAQVRGVSLEPMLEPMRLADFLICEWYAGPMIKPRIGTIGGKAMPAARLRPALNWVIVGAESGSKRRPFKVSWAERVYEQCKAAAVAFFGKQDSGLHPGVPLVLPHYGEVKEWPR
jgi:protein gp37